MLPRGPVDATLTCGGLTSQALSAPGEVDIVSFSGQANQIVLLTLVNTSGFGFGLTARATVVAPSGVEVVTFEANSQRQIALTESGSYTIRVYANNLVATGTYDLKLDCP